MFDLTDVRKRFSPVHFQALMMKKITCKYYNKRIRTRDNCNVQSHDQEERKLSSTINGNSTAHALTHNKIIKSPSNKSNVTSNY